MSSMIHAEASLVIDARSEELSAVVTDYHINHPAILRKPYVSDLSIAQSDQGTGTVLWGSVNVLGQKYAFHQFVSEPEPGHVSVETALQNRQYIRFSFEPINGGVQTRVTITGEFPTSPGVIGMLERAVKPLVAHDIYRAELQQLANYMHRKRAAEYNQ